MPTTVGTLAEVADLAAWLGITLEANDPHAKAVLEAATATIQAEAEHRILAVAGDEKKLRGTWAPALQLPEPPVAGVTAVTVTLGALATVLDVETLRVTRWGKLYQASDIAGGLVPPPSGEATPALAPSLVWGGPMAEVAVTYTHGFDEVPAELKALCLQVAGRAYENPSGVERESIGTYSVGYARVAGVVLTEAERRIARRYRTPSG